MRPPRALVHARLLVPFQVNHIYSDDSHNDDKADSNYVDAIQANISVLSRTFLTLLNCQHLQEGIMEDAPQCALTGLLSEVNGFSKFINARND